MHILKQISVYHNWSGRGASEGSTVLVLRFDSKTDLLKEMAMIKREEGKYVLYSKDGDKLGSHATRAKAVAQEIAIKTKKQHTAGTTEQADKPTNIAGTY